MVELLLGPALRYVSDAEATVWVETDAPSTVGVRGTNACWSAPTFEVHGHHYALVVVDGLLPASCTEYTVELDGRTCWPPGDQGLPPSSIRTFPRAGDGDAMTVLFGSCRAAAPHRAPYWEEHDGDDDARGVDTLWASAMHMLDQPVGDWPLLAVFMGDQVYADDASPGAAERIADRRRRIGDDCPDGVVADFEEYTWLYHESWSPPVERWFMSVVPTMMIIDDHDVIDDWNISSEWVSDMAGEPWWPAHITGALVSYLVYQHAGNLSPAELRSSGLAELFASGSDITTACTEWMLQQPRLSHARTVGDVRVVVIDSRLARVLEPDRRRMVDDTTWQWVQREMRRPCNHLVVVTSLPIFVPDAVHDLQQWNEALCAGQWGRRAAQRAEALRRELDLEDWSAFHRSFDDMCELLADVADRRRSGAPSTVTLLAGDIHFAYAADVQPDLRRPDVRVRQVVSSPMRNALVTTERGVIRFTATRVGTLIGRMLARAARRPRRRHRFSLVEGPVFHNNIGTLRFGSDTASAQVATAVIDDDRPVLATAFEVALHVGDRG